MNKVQITIAIIGLLLLLFAEVSITINDFHWEFKGLASIIFNWIKKLF